MLCIMYSQHLYEMQLLSFVRAYNLGAIFQARHAEKKKRHEQVLHLLQCTMKHQLPSLGTSNARTHQIYQKPAEVRLEGWTGRSPKLMRRKFLFPSTCNAVLAFHLWHLLCSLEEKFLATTLWMVDCQWNYEQDERDREVSELYIIPCDSLCFQVGLANIWQLQIKIQKVKLVKLYWKSSQGEIHIKARFLDEATSFHLGWTL